jgi:hypothetical protein
LSAEIHELLGKKKKRRQAGKNNTIADLNDEILLGLLRLSEGTMQVGRNN